MNLTRAQELTLDALASHAAEWARGAVDIETVPAPIAGAVLAIVTADSGGAPDHVTAVYDRASGVRAAVRGESDYLAAVATNGAPNASVVARESSALYLVHAGGTFERMEGAR